MTDFDESNPASTPRERELELEVARLQAELDMARGEDPTVVSTRLLSLAAETAERAVADARREADEIVEEISSQAEARRDEATRVAAEAEAIAEEKLAEADRAQRAVDAANEEAAAIKAAAEDEAAEIIAAERQMLAAEAEAFAEVRSALNEERVALETYHDSLRQRVKELAESMVSFMDNDLSLPPVGTPGALTTAAFDTAADTNVIVSDDDDHDDADDPTEIPASEATTADPLDTPAPGSEAPAETSGDPWVEMLEIAIPDEDQIVDMPDTAIGEVPAGPPASFAGVPVIEDADDLDDEVDDGLDDDGDLDDEKPSSAGLFSRARGEDETVGFDDLAGDDHDDEDEAADQSSGEKSGRGGLFGMLGSRLVEQTRPEDLAEALEADDSDDQAFRQFLDGDDAPDPSRDWLLRPEQS